MTSASQIKLIGSIQVQPPTVQPGQPVLIQVLDPGGRPYLAGSGLTITINGVEAPSLYCQFTQPGSRPIAVRAVKGSLTDFATATVQVSGAPLTFRLTTAEPVINAMPIIQVNQDFASPYTAQFRLATPNSALRLMALKTSFTAPAGAPAAPAAPAARIAAVATMAAPYVATAAPLTLEDQVGKMIAGLPAQSVTVAQPRTLATANGTNVTTAFRLAPSSVATQITSAAGVVYQWDFGDGQTAATTSPNVTHDYFPAINPALVAHSFNVKCTIAHDNLTVTRTLVLHSAYGLCRRMGVAVPYVTGDVFATFQKAAFSGSLMVHNPEASAITLNQMAVVPVSADASAASPAPKFTKMTTFLTIKANSSAGIGVYVTSSQLGALGPNVAGFTVYYSGTMPSGAPSVAGGPIGMVAKAAMVPGGVSGGGNVAVLQQTVPVRFSWQFRIRLTDSGIAMFHIPVFNAPLVLSAVTASATAGPAAVSRPGGQSVDAATKTVAIAVASNPHSATTATQVRAAVQAGLTAVTKTASAGGAPAGAPLLTPAPPPPPAPGPIQAGQYCDPDNISDADAATATSLHLACQLTNETGQRTMPGSYQNAQMGDVILTPGGNSPISQLLRGLTPPQYHSHSGVMTQNHVEVTHCTAAEGRYSDNTAGLDGAGGIQPDILHYGWPGCITQSLDNAIGGQDMLDPAGKTYNIGGFNAAPTPEFSLVPPLVIKPLPENEAAARPILRKAAGIARSKGAQIDSKGNLTFQKGACYYSFYGYTEPEIGAGFGDPAPAAAGWAQGLTPSVCSAFVWLCMKEAGAQLLGSSQYETASELSKAALDAGAAVESTTLDGLFYYPQQEREQASQVLNTIFQNQVLDQEGFIADIPGVGTAIASSIADQILNEFASGNPNLYGSSAWQTPGDANAVSPDNISWWNTPLFGYAEPVQYLQPHTEQYTNSKWTTYATSGAITGTVTLDGAPANGVGVGVYDGKSAMTGPNGQYTLSNVPVGSYTLTAKVVKGGIEYQNGLTGQPVQLTTAIPNVTANIALQTLPDPFRDVVVVCQITSCDHGDDNPFNTHGVQSGPLSTYHIALGPGQIASSCFCGFDYNGGGYFTAGYNVDAVLAEDLSVQITVIGTITDDGSHNVQNTVTFSFNVTKDGWYSGYWNGFQAGGTGYHNGPVNFTINVSNNKETS